MKKLQLVSSNQSATPPRPPERRILTLLLALAMAGGVLGYQHWIRGPANAKEAIEAAAYQSAVANAAPKVDAAFRQWIATSMVSATAVDWSGASATAHFVDMVPESVSMTGRAFPPEWIVWARSPTGLKYRVTYMLDANLAPVAVDGPEVVNDEQVIAKLIEIHRGDVIPKFGLAHRVS